MKIDIKEVWKIFGIDIAITEGLQRIQMPVLNEVMIFFSGIGNLGIVWIVLALILVMRRKTRNYGIILLLALLITVLLGEGMLKNIIKRNRPFIVLNDLKLLIPPPGSYSFPSGHTASSFTVFGVFYFLNLKYKWAVFFMVFLIAFSRIYLGVHYFTDIIGGIILGMSVAFIVCSYYKKITRNKFN
jgi:undecaprenyl-diphosphatase